MGQKRRKCGTKEIEEKGTKETKGTRKKDNDLLN